MKFNEYKAAFFAENTPKHSLGRWSVSDQTPLLAWGEHIRTSVCKTGDFPEFDADDTPLNFSETHLAIKNIGGLISDSTSGVEGPEHRATEETVDAKRWVLVKFGRGFVAMTPEQAFARRLPELGDWSDRPERWNDFAKNCIEAAGDLPVAAT
jgi:hypothetical protein